MKNFPIRTNLWMTVAVALTSGFSAQALAQNQADDTDTRLEKIEKQLESLTKKPNRASVLPVLPDAIWHLAGYADATVAFTDGPDPDTFTSGRFNPAFHFQYKDLILLEAEFEIETNSDGETELAMEYNHVNLFISDNNVLVVGKFLSPIGQFQERLHPTWINKAGNAPAGFGHDGVKPGSEVGAMLRGTQYLGKSRMVYSFAVGNGPRMGHEKATELEGFGRDDNSDKSIGGRLGWLPIPYVELGGSFLQAKVDGLEGFGDLEPTRAKYKLWGVDAAYTKGVWDARFEYLKSTRGALNSAEDEGGEVELFEPLKQKAWYAQLAYRMSEVSDNHVIQKLEPVLRYGEYKIEGSHHLEEEEAEKRLTVGLNYWLAPSIVVRGTFDSQNFIHEETPDAKRFMFQIAYGF